VETPGAGGYGRPGRRATEMMQDDLRSGKFSPGYMRQYYGRALARAKRNPVSAFATAKRDCRAEARVQRAKTGAR
jgi:N-methylhydantoinase B/oxoprolinase/acetone carboxylase alpha subunit